MDNIGKLLLGVVGVIGLIVLMIPQGNPLADKGAETTANAIPAAPEAIANEAPKNEPETAAAAPANLPTQDINSFGQPMLDPTPPGQRKAQDQQPNQPMGNEGNYGMEEGVAPFPANPSMGTGSYGDIPAYQPSAVPPIQ